MKGILKHMDVTFGGDKVIFTAVSNKNQDTNAFNYFYGFLLYITGKRGIFLCIFMNLI